MLRNNGGTPSPPTALEGSSQIRAVNVSCKVMFTEQKECWRKEEDSKNSASDLMLKTE